eukprot:s4628_g9.t1
MPQQPGTEGLRLFQRATTLAKAPKIPLGLYDALLPDPVQTSLTEEFLQAVRSAEQAQAQEPPILDPLSLEVQSTFVQELWDFWHDISMQHPEESEPVFRVETWFVDHVRFDRCYHPRNVKLHSNFLNWETALLTAWHDRVQPGADTHFAIVYPTPENMAPTADLQVVIVQQALLERVSIVLSVYDSDPDVDPIRTFCLTLDSRISMASLLDVLQLTADCPPTAVNNECLLWLREEIIQLWEDVLPSKDHLQVWPIPNFDHTSLRCFLLVHGDRIDQVPILTSSEVYDSNETFTIAQAKWCPVHATMIQVLAQASLPGDASAHSVRCFVKDAPLSTSASVQFQPGFHLRVRIDQSQTASRHLTVDFRAVFQVHQWLDSHLFLPQYDLADSLPLHLSSRSWVDALWWSPGTPGHEIRIYYDGSKIHQEQTSPAGAAVAAFVLTDQGWAFAGALSTTLDASASSYTAELSASLLASKFVYDLVKLVTLSCSDVLPVTFCFDSLTVGRQAEGTWQACVFKQMHHLIRSLHRWIESAFPVELHYTHVKAHRGEPGNELVDCLALAAAQGSALHDLQAWITHVTRPQFASAADWLWFLHRTDLTWQGTDLCFPRAAQTLPTMSVLPALPTADTPSSIAPSGTLDIQLATCNVHSLCPNRHNVLMDTGLSGPARQDALLAQFHAAGMHIFAFQETRVRKLYTAHDHRYWLFRSAATSQGHYGILVGFSKTLPIGQICDSHGRSKNVYFEESHFSVIAAEPRYLLLRVHNDLLKCIMIAAHGPHRGYSHVDIDHWWRTLGAAIPSQYALCDRVFLTDANSRVGAEPCSQIGSFQSDQVGTGHSDGFIDFVRSQGLILPATFANYQQSDGATWRHSGGSWSRIDYVGIPAAWNLDLCEAWICIDIDASLCKEDHRIPAVHVRRTLQPFGNVCAHKPFKLHLTDIDPSVLQQVEVPSLTVDVHSHAALLQANLFDSLWDCRQPKKPVRIRTTMTEWTWSLVCEKRDCRATLASLNRTQRRTLLEAWFRCWRAGLHQVEQPVLFASYDALLAHQDRLIASHYSSFRQLGQRVCKALRADDAHFYADLLTDGAMFLQPFQAKKLWNVVRRSLPKAVQRRLAPNPFQLERLDDQWSPHFQQLELGQPIQPDALVKHCAIRQAKASLTCPASLPLDVLPSLTQLEGAIHATQCHRATGYDPLPSSLFHQHPAALARVYFDLVFKEYCWQTEPLPHKGGSMALIPKKPTPHKAKDFRGILLLENLPKRVHAVLRTQVMKSLHPCRAPGQLGGFDGQEVLFGSQAIRTFGRLADSFSLSSAVLFVDLASAFHHLIREAVVGCASAEAFEEVLQALALDGMPTQKLTALMQLPNLLQQFGVAEPLVRLLLDIHYDTWCTFGHRHLLRTKRGTRPGSPLADIRFHALMAQVGFPSFVHGIARKEALVTAGPRNNLPTTLETQRAQWQVELDRCKACLEFPWRPDDPIEHGARTGDALTEATLAWFRMHYPHGPTWADKQDLGNPWLEILADVPADADSDQWCAFVFMPWGEQWLPELIADLLDGQAEQDIEGLLC